MRWGVGASFSAPRILSFLVNPRGPQLSTSPGCCALSSYVITLVTRLAWRLAHSKRSINGSCCSCLGCCFSSSGARAFAALGSQCRRLRLGHRCIVQVGSQASQLWSSELLGHLKHKGEARGPQRAPGFQRERRRLEEVAMPGASGVARWGSPRRAARIPAEPTGGAGARRPCGPAPEVIPGTRASRRFQVLAAELEKGPPLGRAFCVCQTKHEGRVSEGGGPGAAQRQGAGCGLGKHSSVGLNCCARPEPQVARSQGVQASRSALCRLIRSRAAVRGGTEGGEGCAGLYGARRPHRRRS